MPHDAGRKKCCCCDGDNADGGGDDVDCYDNDSDDDNDDNDDKDDNDGVQPTCYDGSAAPIPQQKAAQCVKRMHLRHEQHAYISFTE